MDFPPHARPPQHSIPRGSPMDEGSKGSYIEERGPTYAAQSLHEYISVLQ